jgi:hypothetical protein
MPKYEPGLHKEISAIFNGVPLPQENLVHSDNADQTRPHAAVLDTETVLPKPSAPESQAKPTQKPDWSTQQSLTRPASPAQPEVVSPTRFQADMSEPPAAQPKPPKASAAMKNLRQWWEQIHKKIKSRLLPPKPGVSPTRQKIMVILVPVLFVAMVVALIQVFAASPQKKPVPAGVLSAAKPAGSNIKIDWKIPEPYPTTLRDPMQSKPTTTDQLQSSTLIVRGIVFSQDHPTAIIDTQIVRPGDKVSGVTVVKINPDGVEFEMNDKKWTQKVEQ